MIGTDEFVQLAKSAIVDVIAKTTDPTDNIDYDSLQVYFVTCTYVLGNIKGMFSTSIPDGKYYEVTYDKDKQFMYVDQYVKVHQEIVDFKK